MSLKDLEMLWVKLLVDNVRPIVIVTVYRPPQGSYLRCCELISEAFERADLKDNTDIFLLGDFNINYSDKNTPAYRELDFTAKSLGLRQLITSPTRTMFREGIQTETTIDLLFTNSDFISDSGVLGLNISDHVGVWASRKKLAAKANKIDFRGRSTTSRYFRTIYQMQIGWISLAQTIRT